jgi:hypothetical protein
MIPKKDFDEKKYREAMQIYIKGLYGIKDEELAEPSCPIATQDIKPT